MHLVSCLFLILSLSSCYPNPPVTGEFPDFITENDDYFVTRIGSVPDIDEDTYELTITGLVENPRSFTLEELRDLELIELPLTVECIGNSRNGSLVSTAVWTGFSLYDFLDALGLDEQATGVSYLAADGYYASHTLEQIQDNQVMGALFMNAEVIPPIQGFPLRIIIPGFYGAKQAAWVTEIEVIDRPLEDYWQDRGWDVAPPMDVDSTIFFPENNTTIQTGVPLEIGGAAFGGTRISTVEVTTDGGDNWQQSEIVVSMDVDNVWVFWKATVVFRKPGIYTVNSRATDINDNVQPEIDQDSRDGTNSWPSVTVEAVLLPETPPTM
jgi:DMSO/TMAO reductase YedYZ molybdopterin-dependent catalytic subunit